MSFNQLKFFVFFLTLGFFSSDPALVFAANTAAFDSGTDLLEAVEEVLTGDWAKILSTIAVAALAITCFKGYIHWVKAISIAAGIVILLNARAIVDGIAAVGGS